LGETTNALRTLGDALQHEEETVRVLAANFIDTLDEKARPLLPECRAALDDQNKYVVRVLEHTVERLSETN
jgi:hypothetical protein